MADQRTQLSKILGRQVTSDDNIGSPFPWVMVVTTASFALILLIDRVLFSSNGFHQHKCPSEETLLSENPVLNDELNLDEADEEKELSMIQENDKESNDAENDIHKFKLPAQRPHSHSHAHINVGGAHHHQLGHGCSHHHSCSALTPHIHEEVKDFKILEKVE